MSEDKNKHAALIVVAALKENFSGSQLTTTKDQLNLAIISSWLGQPQFGLELPNKAMQRTMAGRLFHMSSWILRDWDIYSFSSQPELSFDLSSADGIIAEASEFKANGGSDQVAVDEYCRSLGWTHTGENFIRCLEESNFTPISELTGVIRDRTGEPYSSRTITSRYKHLCSILVEWQDDTYQALRPAGKIGRKVREQVLAAY